MRGALARDEQRHVLADQLDDARPRRGRRGSSPSRPARCRRRPGPRSRPSPRSRRRSRRASHPFARARRGSPTESEARPRCRGSSVGCMPKTPSLRERDERLAHELGPADDEDRARARASEPPSSVSSALTSFVSMYSAPSRAAISSNAHWPERSGRSVPASVDDADDLRSRLRRRLEAVAADRCRS